MYIYINKRCIKIAKKCRPKAQEANKDCQMMARNGKGNKKDTPSPGEEPSNPMMSQEDIGPAALDYL